MTVGIWLMGCSLPIPTLEELQSHESTKNEFGVKFSVLQLYGEQSNIDWRNVEATQSRDKYSIH